MPKIDIDNYIEQSGMRKARFGGYEPEDVRQAMLDLCADYEQHLAAATAEARAARQENDALRRHAQNLMMQNQTLSGQNATLAGQVDKLQSYRANLETQFSTVKERNHSLTNQVDMLRLKNSDLVRENKELTEQCEEANSALRVKGRLAGGTRSFWAGKGNGRLLLPHAPGQGAEGGAQAVQLLRGIPGREHEDKEVPVRKLAVNALLFQNFRHFLPGIAEFGSMNGDFQGFRPHQSKAVGQKRPFQGGNVRSKGCNVPGHTLQKRIGPIQGLQNQPGGTGGAKEGHGGFGLLCGPVGTHMQIGPAGEHGQGLMGGIAAQVRPQIHGVQGPGEEF